MKNTLTLVMIFFAAIFTANGQSEKIKFVEYDLSNGLHVILHADDRTPNVMVSLMYHVGAKNEDPSRTGFAHFFEHLMFEGSDHIGRGEYFKMIQAAGGSLNANTSQDRTFYFENMPSNQLELALWMEAERMLHAKIDTIGVNTQKGVVIEERKQSYDNRPYGTFMEELGKRAFTVHPYQWQTIGDPEHIRAATFDDIKNFYDTYYVPNNCVLVIAGDFEEKQTRQWVDKYFGSIPRGTLPMYRPEIVEPMPTQEIKDVVYDNIQLPALFMAYHAPEMGTREAYAMDILTQILSGGASSRLKTNLEDKGLTLQSQAFNFQCEDPGLLYVLAIPNMGTPLADVEAALTTEVERMSKELVSEEEFQMAMAAKEFEVAANLQSLAGKAQALCDAYTYFKDAERVNKELATFQSITREDIQNVARKYLQTNTRVVLHYVPMAEKNESNTND
ncbi:pitrilysin family protein [Parabacteroides sp. PF5-6]|uniref:M16 family metallopeptidase n=1 Tax=Parabacteroides sp. PF5-6 TaxID=1742403 RepID=UPI002404BF36|nr:pitrilysin family protein [Parabacteroides sp. PF5-6]MDF9830337.1 zinc protease [Parabacteroides sp. PF5-6]